MVVCLVYFGGGGFFFGLLYHLSCNTDGRDYLKHYGFDMD